MIWNLPTFILFYGSHNDASKNGYLEYNAKEINITKDKPKQSKLEDVISDIPYSSNTVMLDDVLGG